MLGSLRTQASASEGTGEAIMRAAVADVDRLRRFDGTYDQTFVRLEILVQRPAS